MELPRVKILFENGALGSTVPSEDGVVGLITQGTEVADKFALGSPYIITSLNDLGAMGITSQEEVLEVLAVEASEGVEAVKYVAPIAADANRHIYKTVKEFYKEAPAGSKMWIMAVADTVSMKDMVDKDKAHATKLLEASKCAISLLIVSKTTEAVADYGTVATTAASKSIALSSSLDNDVFDALSNAQLLGENVAETKFAPFFTIIEGRGYTGDLNNLENLHTHEENRAGIFIGDTVKGSMCAAVGLIAGRIAAIPVQRSIARVKSGAIAADDLYINSVGYKLTSAATETSTTADFSGLELESTITSTVAENAKPEMLHTYGYITVRTFVGKAGYYFSDDKLATAISDDYALIPRRRTIDKAYRIAYQTLVNELNDEIPVTDKNTIPAPIVKSIQNKVEAAIERSMTAYGNLGNDSSNPNDTGVACYINPDQDVVSGSTLNIVLQVKPYGYAKYINVNLGFKTTTV